MNSSNILLNNVKKRKEYLEIESSKAKKQLKEAESSVSNLKYEINSRTDKTRQEFFNLKYDLGSLQDFLVSRNLMIRNILLELEGLTKIIN